MPPYDGDVHDWIQERTRHNLIMMTREGLRLTLEYRDRPKAGPLRPPWEQFGYKMARLDRVSPVPGDLAKSAIVYSALLMTLLAAFLFGKGQGLSWHDWQGPRPQSWRRAIALGAVTALAGIAAAAVYVVVMKLFAVRLPAQEIFAGISLPELLWTVPAIVLLAPLAEELLFRRVIFGRFWREDRTIIGAFVSSLLFAVAHGMPLLIPVFFVHGMLWCWLYRRTGDLLAPMSAHATVNLIGCAALAVARLRS